jgi:pentatricopeptide repeat protein
MKKLNAYKLWKKIKSQKNPLRALRIFNSAPTTQSDEPFHHNHFTYDIIIHKLGSSKMFAEMETILDQLRTEKGFKCKEGLLGNVIKLYGRARMAEAAMKTFQRMPLFGYEKPTIRSFNTLFNALLSAKRFDMLQSLYETMPISPDSCTYNILIKAACIDNRLEDAWDLFDRMRNPTVVTYGTLISALCANMNIKQAFRLMKDMTQMRLCPNVFIYTSLIGGLCNVGLVDEALKMKMDMVGKGLSPDTVTYSTLINGLCKVGRSAEARKLLHEMSSSGCPLDIATYNVLITDLCRRGNFQGAHDLLEAMRRSSCKPDVISYNILISGLCREGKLEEATEFFEDMPRRGCLPDVVTFRILLDGLCGVGRFLEATMILDEMVFKGFGPRSSSATKLISGLCEEGKLDLAFKVLRNMEEKCLIELSTWDILIPHVCNKSEQEKASELIKQIVQLSWKEISTSASTRVSVYQ